MSFAGIPLTMGVEEEYQIIHPKTRDLHSYVQEFLEHGKLIFPDEELKPEFMQSQIEVGSQVCRNIKEVKEELKRLRRTVCQIAHDNDLLIAAASTHPFASWLNQSVTPGQRYRKLLDHMQGVASQLLIFGFHIHVGFGEKKDLMIEMMNQLRYFLPHILAISTSSPFWQGRDTGLKSYRSVVFEMLPRTGIPQSFRSYSEYTDFVDLLGKVGSIMNEEIQQPDPTKIWWDVRPNLKFGTLEIRIADIGTKIEEATCIAAIIQALVAKLIQMNQNNQSWRHYRRSHIVENKWRAMRYGIEGKLIDFGKKEEIPMRFLILEMMELIDDVVDELGSREEVNYLHTILSEGTSADRQLHTYNKACKEGASPQEALFSVVDQLVAETMQGTGMDAD